jgi:hypothetical protein
MKIHKFLGFILSLVALAWGLGTPADSPAPHRLSGNSQVPGEVRPVLDRACLDCHSRETRWPWYEQLPLIAGMIKRDVNRGREHLDFSTWTESHPPTANEVQDICDAVSNHAMPPLAYRLMHADARISDADADTLCGWALRLRASRLPDRASAASE